MMQRQCPRYRWQEPPHRCQYRPLAPSPFPYVVRVSLPAGKGRREEVRTYRVRVPEDGSGAVVHAVFP